VIGEGFSAMGLSFNEMTRRMKFMFPVIAWAAILVVQAPNQAAACPNCKEAVSLQGEDAANLSSGFNWSVLFMLAVPFSLLGAGSFMVRRAVKLGTLPEL
jgi:hypothetical protein